MTDKRGQGGWQKSENKMIYFIRSIWLVAGSTLFSDFLKMTTPAGCRKLPPLEQHEFPPASCRIPCTVETPVGGDSANRGFLPNSQFQNRTGSLSFLSLISFFSIWSLPVSADRFFIRFGEAERSRLISYNQHVTQVIIFSCYSSRLKNFW